MSASVSTARFRRLVLELAHGAADPAMMREAAAMARLLGADLHALFVEDETLLHQSAYPFAREISPVSYQWRPLETGRLEAELRAAADQARRRLREAAQAIGVRQNFEVRRGDLAAHVSQICVASDIVVVSAPPREGSATAHGFRQLRETARRSLASVLFLPPGTAWRHRTGGGPVVAVALGADDPSVAVAAHVAARGHERLIVLATADTGPGIDATVRPLAGTTPQDIAAALGDLAEGLIVMTGDGDADDAGAILAAARHVPVLVVEPRAGAGGAGPK